MQSTQAESQGIFSSLALKFAVKRIDVHLLKSFIPPFIVTFFVTEFVLIMQFLWVYVDDLVGKELSGFVIAQLLFYASASTVPLAIPLATLLSSMMTIGNLGEQYELTSFKSSGISLWRIVRSLILIAVLLCGIALAFSNYVLPVANLKFGTLLYDIRQQRPALNIKPGIFYNEIEGYSIRVKRKDEDNRTLHDVLIYDHTHGKGNDYVITAKEGQMYLTADKHYLVLELSDGNQFQELNATTRPSKKYEQIRVEFKEWKKVFDLSEFALSHSDENLFKENYKMLNLRQLSSYMDTLNVEITRGEMNILQFAKPYYTFLRVNFDSTSDKVRRDSTRKNVRLIDSSAIVSKALSNVRNVKSYSEFSAKTQKGKVDVLRRYGIELQRKFSLSFACFILFLFGVSLGAIIRKGGFGLPFVISVFFFIIFYILSIAGEKMAREGVLTPFWGMWFSSIVLLPFALYLMYKANRDSALLNIDTYTSAVRRFIKKMPLIGE